MNETVSIGTLALTLVAGLILGGIFFGGLWWTVRKGVTSRRPALFFSGSLLLRLAIVLGGFYLVAGASWKGLLACLVGFTIARFIVLRTTRDVAKKEETRRAEDE